MKLKFLVFSTFMLFAAITVHAQAQSDSTQKYQLIEELFKITRLEESCRTTAQQAADQVIAQNQLQSKRAEVESFYAKYMSYQNMKEMMAKLYAKYYTTDDLKELVRFYQTPAGQKFNTASMSIANDAFMANNALLQSKQKELQDLINQQNP
ncbi:DUF2059 domain-containing protein [Pseudoflavitalea rhizosphaerae]|uniref:DUF2059 domain-containing protein n=1 Tax=Pseudoflavitalea rhizosphaerae TaxID=1884793 RepID=UPI000F8D214F|nr:DUF2059 domain-containing protein [Pseudoflavitalea rhizosphaerae]